MTITQQRLVDLLTILNSLTPADVGDIKANRKVNTAIVELTKVAKDYTDKFEALQDEINAYTAPFRKQFEDLKKKLDTASEEKKESVQKEITKAELKANEGLVPYNVRLETLAKDEGGKEVEFTLDANILSEIKSQFSKHAPAKFKSSKALIEICDVLGIEE